MSIRIKIVLSLIAVSLTLIVSYVFTAQRVFENDKVSYVFEDQHNKLQNILSNFHQKIDDAIWFSRFFSSDTKNQTTGVEDLKALFNDQTVLSKIYIHNNETQETRLLISKTENDATSIDLTGLDTKNSSLTHVGDDQFILTFPLTENSGNTLILYIQYPLPTSADDTYQYVLLYNNKIISQFGAKYLNDALIQTHLDAVKTESTSMTTINENEYILSSVTTRYKEVQFISFIPKNKAFDALSELYNKTIIYILISILSIFIVSYLLSHSITYRMRQLTKTAELIGAGNFDSTPPFESNDEVGTLAKAFRKMGQEIKLLFESKLEKDRMEKELQTASLVQKQLFPEQQNMSYEGHFLSGYYTTSTECGGDWWYHFQVDSDVYVIIADATGHGIPAALITSASNAIFSHLRGRDYNLEEIVRIWDETVFQSSKGEIYMTGQICKYNLVSGDGEIVNLGHEIPAIFSKEHKVCTPLVLEPNFSLGERSKNAATVNSFHLNPGETIALYTDGLLEITPDGTVMSEKRFFKKLHAFFSNSSPDRVDAARLFYEACIQETGNVGKTLNDDVTLVFLARL
jgi:phosphoserine phosphatase RsbU/P